MISEPPEKTSNSENLTGDWFVCHGNGNVCLSMEVKRTGCNRMVMCAGKWLDANVS